MATSHVACVLTEQEHTRRTLLMGLAETAHWHARSLVVSDRLVHHTSLLRVAEARLKSIHANLVLGKFSRKTLNHVRSSALRGVVEHLCERIIRALLVVDF